MTVTPDRKDVRDTSGGGGDGNRGGGGTGGDTNFGEFLKGPALLFAIVLTLLGAFVLQAPFRALLKIDADQFTGDAADTALASMVGLCLVVVGGVLVFIGAWMAIVEWRSQFKAGDPALQAIGINVKEILEALGGLRGAALVMVVGGLLMLGAAWVGQSSAEPGASGPTGPTGAAGATG